MPDFEFLEHTSDVYVRSYGRDLKEALVNGGKGLTALLIKNFDKISSSDERTVEINAKDIGELTYLWLEELIFLFDSEAFLFRDFSGEIEQIDSGYMMIGVVRGEKFDANKHRPGIHVKGVTYHEMAVDLGRDEVRITVLLDI